MHDARPRYRVSSPIRLGQAACLACLCVMLMLAPGQLTAAESTSETAAPPASQPVAASKAEAEAEANTDAKPKPATKPMAMPHIRIDREKKWVDFDAKVVLRDGKWIELLVCTPGTREYESILTTEAKPSHIHLALLILGQTPGSPMTWVRKDDDLAPVPPTGPAVEVSIHYLKDGKPVVVPAGQWITNRQTNAPLTSSQWLFTGSKFMAVDGQPVYTADVNGSCLSLVNFGDELLARPTTQTNHTDNEQLAANTPLIPQVGTVVVIRLTPVEKAKAADAKAKAKPDAKADARTEQPAPTTQPAK